jgi:NAD(P)-dependent dehydrogenase (short-subunit alcohol dehydrogenase family)
VRVVIITGGGTGIGRAIVERFASGGDRVVSVGRTARETVDEVCDITDEAQVETLFGRLGAPDVLVNNAGIADSAPLEKTTLENWNRHLSVNATGVFLCTRAVLQGMRERGHGRIITVASTAGKMGARYTAAYAASKHAVVGLMRAVAAEVAGTGVTANSVCPTFARTPLTERSGARIAEMTGRSEEGAVALLAALSPLGRLVEPDEVAEAIWYLASNAAAVNGQALVIDGGLQA